MKKNQSESFEESLKKLESIVGKLEEGELTLDESLTLYDQGIELNRLCEHHLKHAEEKLDQLAKKMAETTDQGDGETA